MTQPGGDWVVYGTGSWQGPWLTEHNLAAALGRRGGRVLFIEPPISPLTPVRNPGPGRSLRSVLSRSAREVGDGVFTLQPLGIPPVEHQMARSASLPVVRAQVRHAVRELGLDRPAILAARGLPGLKGAIPEETAFVYLIKDWVDAGASLLGKDAESMARNRREMVVRADLVCAISRELCQRLADEDVEATLLRHGFHAELAPVYDRAEPPAEYAALPRPLLGYTGTIDARLDFEALKDLARRLPHASVVLVGQVSFLFDSGPLRRLVALPNVHLLPARDRLELPAFIRYLDCCLIPWRDTEWSRHASPLKLWDYFYAGPPVAGTGCPAIEEFAPPMVYYEQSSSSLTRLVERALASGRAGHAERRATALRNTWDDRAAELSSLVANPSATEVPGPAGASF